LKEIQGDIYRDWIENIMTDYTHPMDKQPEKPCHDVSRGDFKLLPKYINRQDGKYSKNQIDSIEVFDWIIKWQ